MVTANDPPPFEKPPSVAPPTSEPSPLVQVKHLSLIFGRQTILSNIHLSIPRGQTVVIIGESGCGKTMLLKCLVGLMLPTKGSVVFDGHDIGKLGEVEMTRFANASALYFRTPPCSTA